MAQAVVVRVKGNLAVEAVNRRVKSFMGVADCRGHAVRVVSLAHAQLRELFAGSKHRNSSLREAFTIVG